MGGAMISWPVLPTFPRSWPFCPAFVLLLPAQPVHTNPDPLPCISCSPVCSLPADRHGLRRIMDLDIPRPSITSFGPALHPKP